MSAFEEAVCNGRSDYAYKEALRGVGHVMCLHSRKVKVIKADVRISQLQSMCTYGNLHDYQRCV
jgi:hypothetical protein